MGERGSSKQWQEQEYQASLGMIHSSSSIHGNIMSKGSEGDGLEELDQALFLYLDAQDQSSAQEQRQTLNIFPSQPMHAEPSTKDAMTLVPNNSSSKRSSNQSVQPSSPRIDALLLPEEGKETKPRVKREGNGKATTSSSEHECPKTPDPKTLRRLAQNREAARKSRIRKKVSQPKEKAYIQQLESSRIRLSQLEQELHRARSQGIPFGGGALLADQVLPTAIGGLSSGTFQEKKSQYAAMFDMEYGRWLEDHHKIMCQLRAAVEENLPDGQLRVFVDGALLHYDELMNIKSAMVRSDVFHLVSGMWMTPAERCFIWIGGFRPSELIKVVVRHIEPLAEEQILAICGLQRSIQETQDALNQGLEAFYHSLSATITSDVLSSPFDMANYMGQLSIAVDKLTTLEGFVGRADNLRQQTLHRLQQIMTTRQAAHCFLAIAEYFHRLHALSSLWIARPRQ
ncbi:bZIP transcription factor TGA10-like isoform X2 [Typha latifolia]|uniref:bZIP transcription factor TGA10-like isoform X2 n=1 Tax=Typha latifolia TaxID=4733 RepID=UPI003C2B83E0